MRNNNNILGCFQSSGRICTEVIEYPFLEDKFRIINAKAFRRLEYKTQVFINYTGDHYRNRLTHSLEVSQVAVYIARKLNLNEELTEAIALSHDLGHPPFGHAGEAALNEVNSKFDGFDHNAHCIKIVTELEKQFPKFNGLNLTIETLDGILKHNGTINKTNKVYSKLNEFFAQNLINIANNGSLEAQVSSLADDIAYSKHDIDDGIRAGFVKLEDFCNMEIFKCVYDKVIMEYPNIKGEVLKREVLQKFGQFLIDDLIIQTKSNIKTFNVSSYYEIIKLKNFVVSFSEPVKLLLKELKNFLFDNVYRNFLVNRINFKTKKIIRDLFFHFINYPTTLPRTWQQGVDFKSERILFAKITDYIAGMTDRFAVDEHRRIFDVYHY